MISWDWSKKRVDYVGVDLMGFDLIGWTLLIVYNINMYKSTQKFLLPDRQQYTVSPDKV